ncbi:hypothetical protein BHE74_00028987, partial [Ensete ventricosum]
HGGWRGGSQFSHRRGGLPRFQRPESRHDQGAHNRFLSFRFLRTCCTCWCFSSKFLMCLIAASGDADVEKFYQLCDPGDTVAPFFGLYSLVIPRCFLELMLITTYFDMYCLVNKVLNVTAYDVIIFAEKENLCLYGLPNETWEVTLPAEEVPPELPEPALGINFARDGMEEKDWLALVAVHSDAWLLAVAFYFGARFGFDKESRYGLSGLSYGKSPQQ